MVSSPVGAARLNGRWRANASQPLRFTKCVGDSLPIANLADADSAKVGQQRHAAAAPAVRRHAMEIFVQV